MLLLQVSFNWNLHKDAFILKGGKSSCRKVSSFLLKKQESLAPRVWSSFIQRHKYALIVCLQSLVSLIEKSLYNGEYTPAAFLDIYSAFNNSKMEMIALINSR